MVEWPKSFLAAAMILAFLTACTPQQPDGFDPERRLRVE